MKHQRKPSVALATVACLVACAAEPPPTAKDDLGIAIPARWSSALPADGTASPHAASEWWRSFDDSRLDRLIEAGLDHNRDLRAALARLDAVTASRTIAGAEAWPTADVGIDALRARRLFLGFPFGGGGVLSSTTTTFGLSLSLRWELDLWGRVRAGESAAIADVQAALADFHAGRLSLIAQTCRAYFAAVEARQQLVLAESTVAAFRATADDVRDRYRRGVRPALDVHLAETNLANAEATLAQRRDVLQRSLRQIDLLVGRYPSGLAESATTLPDTLRAIPAGLPGELLQRRPDLAAAERHLAAAGCRVEAARAALYPRLALTGGGGTSSEQLEDLVDDDFRVWSIGANLLQPLLHGGALRAEVARREAQRAEALAHFGGAVLRAFVEVEDILATDVQITARRQSLARAAEHARQARDLARQRWQLGLTEFLAVADGQRQAFQADAALIAIDRQRIENRIDLFLALGGGFLQESSQEPTGAQP